MLAKYPRVAYMPDSFHEVNGVAHTSRHFEAFARRRDLPFLSIRAGSRPAAFLEEGNLASLELHRGPLSFALDKDLSFDPGFMRHLPLMMRTLREFRPEIIHITGPSELGLLGAALARRLHVPLVASWHTNVHEYAAKRSAWFTKILPSAQAASVIRSIESVTLHSTARFYRMARVLFAPNADLCNLLEEVTGLRCHLMTRGVDTTLFSPLHRDRAADDPAFVLGFVGRLSIEKNISLLLRIHQQLLTEGINNIRFLIIGQGSEEVWLRQNLPNAELPGVLRGERLSRAYANMDLFVFPSHTDTFGNVVLEALASGVPAIVTPDGGPRYIVRDGQTGFIAADEEFASSIAILVRDRELLQSMRDAARAYALSASWDSVFEKIYAVYGEVLSTPAERAPSRS